MKTMLLLPLSLLLLASTITIFPEAEASGKPVLDVKGFWVLPDVPYYLNVGPVGGGIVGLGDSKNDSCPVDVVLIKEYFGGGGKAVSIPVTFKIAGGQPGFITDYTDVFISFNTTSNCTDDDDEISTVWEHEKDSAGESTEFLKIGGVEGKINTIFRIIQVGSYRFTSTYKLAAYSLSSASSGLQLSLRDVGVSNDFNSGFERLALAEPPLTFGFAPADTKGLNDM